MSVTDMTFEEISESVTGFDEIAVEKHMGMDLYMDSERKPVLLLRSLVFVHMRHQGVKEVEARNTVMEMPLVEVNTYFTPAPPEVEADDPVTEVGKDESQPETAPPLLLTSVSAPA